MKQNEIKSKIITMVVVIATLGALCIATPAMAFERYEPAVEETPPSAGCDDLDQDVLIRYDFDENRLIDRIEMGKAKIGYEYGYETQSDYEQIVYAYEHQCSVRCSGRYSVFMVGGHVYLGTVTVSGADVTLTVQNTGESLTTTTDSNGVYVVALGNLPSGHCAGDTLEVTVIYNGMIGTSSAPRSENLSDNPQIVDVTIVCGCCDFCDDIDGDGVPDVWDVDNNTPTGYWVNSDGVGRMWGDINGDGELTSVDALMILQAAANGLSLG